MSKLDLSLKTSLIKPLSWENDCVQKNKSVMDFRSRIDGDAQRFVACSNVGFRNIKLLTCTDTE